MDLEPLLVGRAKYLIQHPEMILLEQDEREPGPNRGRVHIAAGEELKVWKLLEERGIIEWVNVKDVHQDNGGPFLSGCSGCPRQAGSRPVGSPCSGLS